MAYYLKEICITYFFYLDVFLFYQVYYLNFFKKILYYIIFFLIGISSLTGLIVFIAAVNGAVDNKLTLNKVKEDENPFNYKYGLSFFHVFYLFYCKNLT